jgi:hypothetical protein
MQFIEKYRKAIVALLGAAALVAFQALSALIQVNNGTLNGLSVAFIALSVLSAVLAFLATYQWQGGKAPTIWTSAKFWANVGHVGVQAILAGLGTGFEGLNVLTVAQWIAVVIAVLQASGVGVVPNTDPLDIVDPPLPVPVVPVTPEPTSVPTAPGDPSQPASGVPPTAGTATE